MPSEKPFASSTASSDGSTIATRVSSSGSTVARGDEAGLCASWRGRPLGLTRYQFRLLATLAAQPGRVFSRSELLDLVWDDPAATVDRGVDNLVKTLRARLRAVDPAADLVQTHRGDGYSLKPA